MVESSRRRVDHITDPSYLSNLRERSIDDLRAMKDECNEVENEISFERRLCQARIDILRAELRRRSGDGGKGDLVAWLTGVLADVPAGAEGDTPLPSRAPDFSVPRNADVPRRRVDEIAGEQTLASLPRLDAAEVQSIVEELSSHEAKLSGRRRDIHEVLDVINAEIVRTYREAELSQGHPEDPSTS